MTRANIILAMFILVTTGNLLGQDTTFYTQANASLFSNKYTLVKQNKKDHSGTFQQKCITDDMQYWVGKGEFAETKLKIYLTFDSISFHNHIETVTTTEQIDTIYIKWCDWGGAQQLMFNIKMADTVMSKNIYSSDYLTGIVKIPKRELLSNHLLLFNFAGNKQIFDFIIKDNIAQITIIANDEAVMHILDKEEEILKKNRKGVTTICMWTNGKRNLFVKDIN